MIKQLFYEGKRKLKWRDVAEPELQGPTDALVRPLAVSRCDADSSYLFRDLNKVIHAGLKRNLMDPILTEVYGKDPFAPPFPIGHEGIAEVVKVGSEVPGFTAGDHVVVPFIVSCGSCKRCRQKIYTHCLTTGHQVNMFGFGYSSGEFGGMITDLLRIPFASHMMIKVPNHIPPADIASLSDNIPDGLRTVDEPLKKFPGERVIIVAGGAPSIGLYALSSALALGAGEVLYYDKNLPELQLAEKLGAQVYETDYQFPEKLAPIVVEASANSKGLHFALKITDAGGICTSISIFNQLETPVPMASLYGRNLTLTSGFANPSRDIPLALDLINSKKFEPWRITTMTASWNDAAEAFLTNTTKMVIARD